MTNIHTPCNCVFYISTFKKLFLFIYNVHFLNDQNINAKENQSVTFVENQQNYEAFNQILVLRQDVIF